MITNNKVRYAIKLAKVKEKKDQIRPTIDKEHSHKEELDARGVKIIDGIAEIQPKRQALVDYLQSLSPDECRDLEAIMYVGKAELSLDKDPYEYSVFREQNENSSKESCISQLISKSGYGSHNLSSYLTEGLRLIQ